MLPRSFFLYNNFSVCEISGGKLLSLIVLKERTHNCLNEISCFWWLELGHHVKSKKNLVNTIVVTDLTRMFNFLDTNGKWVMWCQKYVTRPFIIIKKKHVKTQNVCFSDFHCLFRIMYSCVNILSARQTVDFFLLWNILKIISTWQVNEI